MKKTVCLLLSLIMLFSLCACSGNGGDTTQPPESTSNNSEDKTQAPESTSNSEDKTQAPESTSKKDETTSEPTKAEIDLSDIKEKIIAELEIKNSMSIDTDKLSDLYGIDSADVEKSACFITSNGTFPEEVIMIKAKDAAAQKRIVELLKVRIDDVKIQSQSYDAENYAIAQKCKVITNGDYVAMFISALHEKMESIFTQSIS